MSKTVSLTYDAITLNGSSQLLMTKLGKEEKWLIALTPSCFNQGKEVEELDGSISKKADSYHIGTSTPDGKDENGKTKYKSSPLFIDLPNGKVLMLECHVYIKDKADMKGSRMEETF